MKKILFSLALLMAAFGNANAQVQANIGSYKANDKALKGDKAMEEHTSEGLQQALALYAEAETILNQDVEAAKVKGDNAKLARLYLQNAQLQEKIVRPELNLAQQGLPFDTVKFCTIYDKIIDSYCQSQAYNVKPNAKGKVKSDAQVKMYNELAINNYRTMYFNCGAFMDAVGDKEQSASFFKKFINLPKNASLFSETEIDSIYKSDAKTYNTARFYISLQNFNMKKYAEAVAAADEALANDTTNLHDLYLIKINSYGEMKDSANWQRSLVEASQRTGESHYLQNLVYYYLQNNKIEDADKLISQLVAEHPNDKMTWFMKGSIELNIKHEYASSRESFEKALAIDPDFSDALFNMGTAYINDIYDQTQDGKFKYVGTNKNITGKGTAAYNKEKAIYDKELETVKSYYEKARPYLERYRELNPDNAKRWASPLQMVYSALGETDKAKEMDALLEAANQGM